MYAGWQLGGAQCCLVGDVKYVNDAIATFLKTPIAVGDYVDRVIVNVLSCFFFIPSVFSRIHIIV